MFQHTPAIATRRGSQWTNNSILFSKNCTAERSKLLTLEWFRHEIRNHFISWTVLNGNITFINMIRNEVVSNIDSTTSFPGTLAPILLQ
jgi:hypothetical protein